MFENRQDAGLKLAERLKEYSKSKFTSVYAIPRGGVVIAKQIADILLLPLKIIIVKKLSAPGNPELAIGAITYQGEKYIDWDMTMRLDVEQDYLDSEIASKKGEVEQRKKDFGISNTDLAIRKSQVIILVDDGVATGATIMAAVKFLNKSKDGKENQKVKIILAVPVIAKDSYNRLKSQVAEIVALEIPETFSAVGQFYREFPQIENEEVIKIVREHKTYNN